MEVNSRARRLRACALGTSGIAATLALAGPAFAQCAPEPTQTNGTSTCTGTDPNGVTVTTYGTTVSVPVGATVQGGGRPGVAVQLPSTASGSPVTVNVSGRVDGGGQAGVSVLWQPPASGFGFSPAYLNLTVARNAVVTGANAVVIGEAGSGTGNVYATIDNSGTLSSTVAGGVALQSTAPSFATFTLITNRADGTIGAIVGQVGTLTNAGKIDGGTRSAIDLGTSGFGSGTIINTGTIASAGTAATIASLGNGRTLTNAGQIANLGTSAAIAGDGFAITNSGRIATAGATAIQSNIYLTLTNTGTITGNVVTAAQPSYTTGSTIDSSAGTVNGNVTFGAGDDTLVARWNGTALVTGITGTINGGAGTDTVRVRFTADATVGSALTLPTSFERLALAPDAKVTATLVDGFSVPGPLVIAGAGTMVNRTTLTGTTQAVVANDFSSTPTFVNAGTIRTTASVAGTYAVALGSGVVRFENSGTVSAVGDGVSFSSQGALVNTGTIGATGTAVSLFGPTFTNAAGATIRSTGGTGILLSGSSGSNWNNAGRIEGAVAGARISSTLVNTGTIALTGTAPNAVAGVVIDYYGVLDNRQGGVVSGGVAGASSSLFNATIANAGTIDGNVRLTGSASNGSYNANRFFALTGGAFNGNLTLGASDVLVAELAGSSGDAFAGINGTVTAPSALLRFRVRTGASGSVAPPAGGFAAVGYDLYDGAALTLTGSVAQSTSYQFAPPVTLAGRGSVDINATIAAATQPAIQVTSLLLAPGEAQPTDLGLLVTSRGVVTLDHPNNAAYPGAAVALTGNDSFTNAGSITARDRATTIYSPVIAISGGKAVTNSGTVTLDAATGVSGAATLTNTGSIVQAAGGRAATGVVGVAAIANSGTIDVAGNAVQIGYNASLTNSGRIASSTTAAITAGTSGSSYGATITNLAGGTIAGGAGQAMLLSGGTVYNAGTITGSVDLGNSAFGRSFAPGTFIANGGTLAGNLRFGSGDDLLVEMDGATGVTGSIDGGLGTDLIVHARTTGGTVTLGTLTANGFELEGIRALGAGTVVTVAAAAPYTGNLYVSGEGTIANGATLNGNVVVGGYAYDYNAPASTLGGFTNNGSIAGAFSGTVGRFANNGALGSLSGFAGSAVNAGAIGSATLAGTAAALTGDASFSFANSGQIANNGRSVAVSLDSYASGSIAATNSGTITGGLEASSYRPYVPADAAPATATVSLANTGTITRAGGIAAELYVDGGGATQSHVTLTNSGLIEATGINGIGGLVNAGSSDPAAVQALAVTNTGTIRATGNDSFALLLNANAPATTAVTNAAGGLIEATGTRSAAVIAYDTALNLTNAGTVRGGAGTALALNSAFAAYLGAPYLAGAIQTRGGLDDRIVNTGAIIGSIVLGAGSDRVENRGRIEGDVFLGEGDDSFLHQASGTLTGTIDGGEGTDALVIDAVAGGSVDGDRFVMFERVDQIGQGDVAYRGTFRVDTIGLGGGGITVDTGQTLATSGSVTITGSDAAERVTNNGTIAASMSLAGGNDTFVNNGAVGSAVSLGDGDDGFVEGSGSRVAGGVDGGAGNDFYTALLAGNRQGLGARTGFERLAVTGTGTLTLTLDQDFAATSLMGTGLNATLAGHTLGVVTGSDAAETLTVNGDVASATLGAGDDVLSLGTTRAAGRYDGVAGDDLLRFSAAEPVTLAGSVTGFERIALASSALIVSGTLGSTGAPLLFGAGDQQLAVAIGGTLVGAIDLGAGNDGFRLAANGTLVGTVAGGEGTDTATIELAGARMLASGTLTGFETLATEGAGTLTLIGAHAYDRVALSGDLTVAAGASLAAPQVQSGPADNRFTIAGRFVGSVDGGAGTDTVAVSGGSEAAPVAFGNVSNVEGFAMSGGFATGSGTAALGSVDMAGGRLVGLAGSTMTGSLFTVRQGATFGSAGTVNGNLAVAGTLSPGASPGTMTVNGNVLIQSGSMSLFEITPTAQDKLVVNGTVSIASGATLQLLPSGALRPGTSYDLIVASGGITGSYSTVVKPDSLFGFVVQRADRLQLLGQFFADASFSPQVSRSVAYANAALVTQPATSRLLAALPSLLSAGGASNSAAFAQLTPEPYASAVQLGTDNALALAGAARSPAFAATGEDVHAYTFAQTLGGWHRLADDPAAGTTMATSRSYGFLGGLGIGSATWNVGALAGYLNDRQQLDGLGARTKIDGVVAGVHGRYMTPGGMGVTASVMYDGGQAHTDRALPGAASASSRYDLHSVVGDLSVSYGLGVSTDWELRPSAGVTYLRTTRDGVTEAGSSAFALTVARKRHVAGFAEAGLSFGRMETSTTPFRPWVSFDARYQIEGTRTIALAGYSGGGLGLTALGASRSRVVGTAAGGVAYRLPSGLDLFATASEQTGRDDHQESIAAGVRLRF